MIRQEESMTKCTEYAGSQFRAARTLLNWSRAKLSKESGVSVRSLADIEWNHGAHRRETVEAIVEALRKARITLTKDGLRIDEFDGWIDIVEH